MTKTTRLPGSHFLQGNSKHTELAKKKKMLTSLVVMLGNSASGALTPALSGWAKWGNQKPFIVNPSSLTYQWKMSCAACLLATLPPGNSISLEDKQNGGYRKDRLAPVATGKPLLFTQHKACGGCGAPEKLWDWCIIPVCICCWRMSSAVFHDMGWSICVFFFFSFFF